MKKIGDIQQIDFHAWNDISYEMKTSGKRRKAGTFLGKTYFYFDGKTKQLCFDNISLIGRLFRHLFGYKKQVSRENLWNYLKSKNIVSGDCPSKKAFRQIVGDRLAWKFLQKKEFFTRIVNPDATDEELIQFFKNGLDIHATYTSSIHNPNLECALVDSKKSSVLLKVIEHRRHKVLHYLVENGVDVNQVIPIGHSYKTITNYLEGPVDYLNVDLSSPALLRALEQGDEEMFFTLLDAGADVNKRLVKQRFDLKNNSYSFLKRERKKPCCPTKNDLREHLITTALHHLISAKTKEKKESFKKMILAILERQVEITGEAYHLFMGKSNPFSSFFLLVIDSKDPEILKRCIDLFTNNKSHLSRLKMLRQNLASAVLKNLMNSKTQSSKESCKEMFRILMEVYTEGKNGLPEKISPIKWLQSQPSPSEWTLHEEYVSQQLRSLNDLIRTSKDRDEIDWVLTEGVDWFFQEHAEKTFKYVVECLQNGKLLSKCNPELKAKIDHYIDSHTNRNK